MKLYLIDWPIIDELWRPRPDPRVLEELLRLRRPKGPPGPVGPDPIEALASAVVRIESVTERLVALADALPGTDAAALAREILEYAQDTPPEVGEEEPPDSNRIGGDA